MRVGTRVTKAQHTGLVPVGCGHCNIQLEVRSSICSALAALEHGSDESDLFQNPRAMIEIQSGSVGKVYHVWCASPRLATRNSGNTTLPPNARH
jgi:hypothetical protein